jgi:transposase
MMSHLSHRGTRMTVENINVEAAVKRVNDLIAREKDLSPALRASLEVLLLLVSILTNRLGLNSKNSSKPPSADPNRIKNTREPGDRKPGGQLGHRGTTLKPVADPDEVKIIRVDQRTLPQGIYREVGYEARQVIDLDISTVVTEWRAQILEDQSGKRYVASFPKEVARPVQYGIGVKVNSVYMSQYQLIPYNRIEDHFWDQMGLSLSAGSIHNFNQEVYERLELFESWVRDRLGESPLIHVDETGINIGGTRCWLHTVSNDEFTCFSPHAKRGGEAMEEMSILPGYKGIMCHDHWKPYFKYGGAHALCNAHHLRELQRAVEQDKQQWAEQMIVLLKEINKATHEAGGRLEITESEQYRKLYRDLLHEAEKECPAPDETGEKKKGKTARSKARNLLERLRDFENDALRFMMDSNVPFSNNQAENDLRMTKVQQKVSGCFRSFEGAKIFCRIRSYLSTCRKQGITASEGLRLLFQEKWPLFMNVKEQKC